MSLNFELRQKLHLLVPEGVFVPRSWLLGQGVSQHAIDNLLKSKQLELISRGVYKRPYAKLTWQGVVLSLQKMYDFEVVVGGYTAIEMQGYSHYLSLNKERQIHLFSKKPLPDWIEGLIEGVNFIMHLQSELKSRKHLKNEFSSVLRDNIISFPWREEMPQLKISNPERAILEVLVDVPDKISFEHAEQILQGMTSLSPNKLNELLLVCDNIRVRRLFLWMAERQNHQWFKKLNLEDIFLGSGNRVLVKGGVLNKKYKITVPQEYE
jgi:hypothetical protein